MSKPATIATTRAANPAPDILEPCPWCGAPAALDHEDGRETLRCRDCLIVVEVANGPDRLHVRAASGQASERVWMAA